VQYSWDRHDRLSVIAGICFSPVRHRPHLFFQIHQQNIRFDAVIAFLGLVHRHVKKKFILVLDRYSAHRKAIRLLQEQHPDWIEVVWLPAYAPELNPVEMAWNHSKYGDLANFLPEGIDCDCSKFGKGGKERPISLLFLLFFPNPSGQQEGQWRSPLVQMIPAPRQKSAHIDRGLFSFVPPHAPIPLFHPPPDRPLRGIVRPVYLLTVSPFPAPIPGQPPPQIPAVQQQ